MSRTLSAQDVRQLVTMSDAIEAARSAFIDLAAGHFQQPARQALGDDSFLVMSSHHRPSKSAVVKTLSVEFARAPSISGLAVWVSGSTPEALCADASAVTALRTGAVTGLATDLLAPPEANRLAVIGAGAQAMDQICAVGAVRRLKSVCVVDLVAERAERVVSQLSDEQSGIAWEVSTDSRAAVRSADVVCCVTNASAPLFALSDLAPVVHVNAIGSFHLGLRELSVDLLAQALVVVDQRSAAAAEAGEIDDALRCGALRLEDLHELGDVAASTPERRHPRSVFKSVGLAIQDWSIMNLLAQRVALV